MKSENIMLICMLALIALVVLVCGESSRNSVLGWLVGGVV